MPYDYFYPTIVRFRGLHDGYYLFEVDGPKKVTFAVEKFESGFATFVCPGNCSSNIFIGIVDGCLTEGSNFPTEFRKAFPGATLKGVEYAFGGQQVRVSRLS